MVQFNADEIFEIAEQIERNGAAFYHRAAEGAPERCARTLRRLADMEVEHQKTFHQMRQQVAGAVAESYDPDGTAAMYLRALAEGRVFDLRSNPAAELSGGERVPEILKIAVGLEKESIVFYTGLKGVLPPGEARESLDRIIDEELGHITMLTKELTEIE